MPEEPLWPHLLELARLPALASSILAGGLGLRLRREFIVQSGQRTLFEEVPEARATSDIDLFLEIRLWVGQRAQLPLRNDLANLGYEVVAEDWKFEKGRKLGSYRISLDLMARRPTEAERVKVVNHRVGVRQNAGIHGYYTPEAFAIEENPLPIKLADGSSHVIVRLAHPYASLNMKVAAARDWQRELTGELEQRWVTNEPGTIRKREKHLSDVFAIIGMMTESELDESAHFAEKYQRDPLAVSIRSAALQLFGSLEAPGSVVIRQRLDEPGRFDRSFDQFWDAIRRALGITS